MGRRVLDITEQQGQSLNAPAAVQGETAEQYAVERPFLNQSHGDEAWQELKALLGQRIAAGWAGGVSAKSFDTIVEEELGQDSRA